MGHRIVGLIKRWSLLVVVLALVAAVPTYLYLTGQPAVYQASATLRVGQSLSGAPLLSADLSNRIAVESAFLATTEPLLEDVIEALGLETSVPNLRARVVAEAALDSALLTITVRDGSKEDAAAIANAIGGRLVAEARGTSDSQDLEASLLQQIEGLRADIDEARAVISELRPKRSSLDRQGRADLDDAEQLLSSLLATQADYLDALQGIGASSLTPVVEATPPSDPISNRTLLFTGIAAALGILLALAIAFLYEYFDDSLKDARAFERAMGLPVIGDVKEARFRGATPEAALITLANPTSETAEAYRRLRANIEFAAGERRPDAVLVTSAVTPAGKSIVAANLAVATAQSGRRAILVDADMRRPTIHAIFKSPSEPGLATLLATRESAQRFLRYSPLANLRILPSGGPQANPADLLGSPRMRQVISELLADCDVLIIDSPPLPGVTDAAILGALVPSTLLVVDVDKAHRDTLEEVIRALALARATLVGALLYRGPAEVPTPGPVSVPPQPAQAITAAPAPSQDPAGRPASMRAADRP